MIKEASRVLDSDHASASCPAERETDVDQRLAKPPESRPFFVSDRHLIIAGDFTVAVLAEDLADASHSERAHLSGSYRAHAGRTDDRRAGVKGQQDLLVTDRPGLMVITVEQNYAITRREAGPQQVPVLHRIVHDGVGDHRAYFCRGQRRSCIHMNGHNSVP